MEGPFSVVVTNPETEVIEAVIMTAGGPPGPAGEAATVSIGTTTTGVAGSNANVVNIGTSASAVLNFEIPRGATGATGGGVPTGGTVGQTIAKIDSTDFNTQWLSIPSADTVSARVVSVSAELNSLLTSAANFLSARITSAEAAAGTSVTSAKVATASAAATSADAHANTVSARAVSISAELASMIGIASAAATSADAHASVASAAATSANAHANTVSIRLVSASAELASLIASGDAFLSARITSVEGAVAGTSVTSAKVQTASAAATSADAHAAAASAAATSADSHANTVSARAVSISAELASLIASGDAFLSARITSAESAGGTGNVSAGGTLTNNSVVLGAGSADVKVVAGIFTDGVNKMTVSNLLLRNAGNADVTLTRGASGNFYTITMPEATTTLVGLDTTDTLTNKTIENAIIGLGSGGGTPGLRFRNSGNADITLVRGGASGNFYTVTLPEATTTLVGTNVTDALSARVVSVSAELASLIASGDAFLSARITSAEAITPSTSVTSAKVQTASAAATSADAHANTVSARLVSASAELASLVQIASAAATSADAHANTVSARVVSVSAELVSLFTSVDNKLSASIQTASAAATSADAHANTVSARVVSASAELASLVQIASAAATSADTHANTVSARAVSISNELGSLLASTSTALQSAINTVSAGVNTVSARVVSVSAELASLMNSADSFLSLRITSAEAAGGGGSITSGEVYSIVQGYSTIATAAGTTAVVAGTPPELFFTGSTTQTVTLPDVTTLVLGKQYLVKNNSSGVVTVQSSGANTIVAMAANTAAVFTCIAITGTGTASWDYTYSNTASDVVSAQLVSVSANIVSIIGVSVSVLSNRVTSVSNELASLLISAVPKRAVNTANQAVTSASTGVTVSGVSVALVSSQVYRFHFTIPFTTTLTNGIMVAVVGPATNTYYAKYRIPGAVGNAGLAPAANAVTPFDAEVRAIGTIVSTTSITLTATTLVAEAWGTINASANGSIKFVIGPNTSGSTPLTPLRGANVLVWRIA